MRSLYLYVKQKSIYLYISIFSILFFLLFYGTKVLNPTNVNWLLSGGLDISQHYSGWIFFRKDEWMFPIGDFVSLSYPNRMSIIYLDSIPLFAVVFKMLRNFLPENFQYFGWYQMMCFVLQGILGVKIVSKYIQNNIGRFLAGVFIVMTPIFLWRVFLHIALSSHWIILLALFSIFYYKEYFAGNTKCKVLYWMMIGFFCTTIHLYFMPMCFIILFGFLYLDIQHIHKIKDSILTMAGFWIGVLLPMFLLGGFMEGVGVVQGDIVWKKSFNLNNFVNSQGWSRFLPKLPLHTYGQSEGFAYLGMGGLLCIGLAIVVLANCVCRGYEIKAWCLNPKVHALILIFILSIIAAASPEITLGTRSIILPIPKLLEEIWSIFRACGRLVWPSVYIMIICACILLSRCRSDKLVILCMGLCVIVQFVDISGEIWDRGEISRGESIFDSNLKDPGWDIIGENREIENIVYVNVSGLSDCASMAEYADRYDKTLSKFYYARNYDSVLDHSLKDSLRDKSDNDIFLFDINRAIDAWNEPELYYYALDDKLLGYCHEIAGLEDNKTDIREYSYSYLCEITESTANSEMIDEFLFLHAGGSYESPEFALPQGNYQFEIEGENMMDSEVSVCTSDESIVDIKEKAMQNIVGNIACKGNEKVKIRIDNPSDHDMVIYRINWKAVCAGTSAQAETGRTGE